MDNKVCVAMVFICVTSVAATHIISRDDREGQNQFRAADTDKGKNKPIGSFDQSAQAHLPGEETGRAEPLGNTRIARPVFADLSLQDRTVGTENADGDETTGTESPAGPTKEHPTFRNRRSERNCQDGADGPSSSHNDFRPSGPRKEKRTRNEPAGPGKQTGEIGGPSAPSGPIREPGPCK